MNRIISLFLVLVVVFTTLTVPAHSEESQYCGANATWSYADGKLTISGTGELTDYITSGSGRLWEQYQDNIYEIEIGSGITEIGAFVFSRLEYLEYVSIPSTVYSISGAAFEYCPNLRKISLESDKYFTMYNGHLYNSTKTKLCRYLNGDSLYTFPESVTEIGDSAFSGSDIGNLTIPEHITTIGNSAFCCCENMHNVEIPDSIIKMGTSTFAGSGLRSVAIPNNITEVPRLAFSNCTYLSSVTFGKNIVRINDSAFSGCERLKSVLLTEKITHIGNSAFERSGLCGIYMGGDMYKIGDRAFAFCTNLVSAYIYGEVSSIGDHAFLCCYNLKTVHIGDYVTIIGESAFSDCYILENVSFGENVSEIKENAFLNCYELKDVALKSKLLRYIRDGAFEDLSSQIWTLDNLYLSKSIISIEGVEKAKNIYYEGTESQWKELNFDDYDNIYYNSDMGRKYWVTFAPDSGIDSSYIVSENDFVLPEAPPEKKGYTFTGWYANRECIGEPFISAEGEALRKVTSHITLYPGWRETVEFTFGRDTFNFNNDPLFFGNKHIIEDEYFHLLTKNLDDISKIVLNLKRLGKFNGSCFGMCAVMMLAYKDKLDLGFFDEGAENAFDLHYPIDETKVSSLIEYYYFIQDIISVAYEVKNVSDTAEIAELIVDNLTDNPDTPIMINYELEGVSPHSVLGCGISDEGDYYKVLIADPNKMLNAVDIDENHNITFAPSGFRSMYIAKDFSYIEYCDVDEFITTDDKMKMLSVVTYDFFEPYDLQQRLLHGLPSTMSLMSLENNIWLDTNFKEFDITKNGESIDVQTETSDYGYFRTNLAEEASYNVIPTADSDSGYEAMMVYNSSIGVAKSAEKGSFEFKESGYVRAASENSGEKTVSLLIADGEIPEVEVTATVKELSVSTAENGKTVISADCSLKGAEFSIIEDSNRITETITADSDEISVYIENGKIIIVSSNETKSVDMTYKVVFCAMGGNIIESISGVSGLISEPVAPKRYGFIFDGWYKDTEYSEKWDFENDLVSDNTYLYAKWEENPGLYHLVTFYHKDNVQQVLVKNGERLTEYPQIPQEDGIIYVWENPYSDVITHDLHLFSAEYPLEECVKGTIAELKAEKNILSGVVDFERCAMDCVMTVNVYKADGTDIDASTDVLIDENTPSESFSVNYPGDEKYHKVTISFKTSSGEVCGVAVEGGVYVSADIYTSGDYSYFLKNNEAYITEYVGMDDNIVIPDTLSGYRVTGIERMGWAECIALTIGEYITYIGDEAFMNLNAETFEVSGDNSAFSSDSGVLFSKDKTCLIKYPVCKYDSVYEVPDGVTEIKDSAFAGNMYMTEISLPITLEKVGIGTFDTFALERCVYEGNRTQFHNIENMKETGLEEYVEVVFGGESVEVELNELIFCNLGEDSYAYVQYSDLVEEGTFYFAIYDKYGRMIQCVTGEIDEEYKEAVGYFSVEPDAQGGNCAVYYFDGATPLCTNIRTEY